MMLFRFRRRSRSRLQFLTIGLVTYLALILSCGGQASHTVSSPTPSSPTPTPAPLPPTSPAPALPPLVVTTSSLPAGTEGAAYDSALTASGGAVPYTWAISAGALPGGLTLNGSSGSISGTPNAAGTFNFTARVTDASSGSQSASLAITIHPPPNKITHVVMVVEENKSFGDVIGNRADMPYLNSLADKYGLATNYFANVLSSQGDYFMLTIGQVLTDTSDYTDVFTGDNIVRHLIAAHKRWKVYAESIPAVGYMGGDQYPYVKIHNPFAYIEDARDHADHMVPISQFADDVANDNLPDYSFVIPNDIDDGHNCAPGTSCSLEKELRTTDDWLADHIAPLLDNPDFKQHGLLLITWDESNGDDSHGGGRVATVLVGAKVKGGFRSDTFFQHQSLLKLSMRALGLDDFPGAAANAPDMLEFFTGPIP